MARLLRAGLLMIDPVAAELRRWASEPFDDLRANCAISVASYAARATGQHLPTWMQRISRIGAARIMAREERFLTIADRGMAKLGCSETGAPKRGDVGLIVLPGSGLTAAICTGRLWAARGDRETVIATGEIRRAWRLPCPRQ